MKKKIIFLLHCPLIWAYLINILYGIYFYPKFNFLSFYDTGSYFDAFSRLSAGRIDMFRVPVYPILLVLFDTLVGKGNAFPVSLGYFQILVFYFSMYYFFRIISQFTKKPLLQAAAVVVYGCASPIVIYHKYLLTESLTISGFVFLLFFLFRHFETKKPPYLISSCILTLLLTMLRPSNVFLFAVTGIYVVGFWISNKKFNLPVLSFAVSIVLLFGYMSLNKIQNNYFGLSIVSARNRMFDIVTADIYHNNSDREMVNYIEAKKALNEPDPSIAYDTVHEFESFVPFDRNGAFINEAIKDHSIVFIKHLLRKALDIGKHDMLMWYSHSQMKEGEPEIDFIPGDFLSVSIGVVYLAALIELLVILSNWIKTKAVPWYNLLIFLTISGQIAVNILAAPGEYYRLFSPVYSLVIICAFGHSK